MEGAQWNQLALFAEKKGKNSEFQFSKQRLFKKKKKNNKPRLIIFFFQTDFHACLGVEAWCLKSVGERPKRLPFLGETEEEGFLFNLPLPLLPPPPLMGQCLPPPSSH